MTADWYHMDYALLGKIANRIINEVRLFVSFASPLFLSSLFPWGVNYLSLLSLPLGSCVCLTPSL